MRAFRLRAIAAFLCSLFSTTNVAWAAPGGASLETLRNVGLEESPEQRQALSRALQNGGNLPGGTDDRTTRRARRVVEALTGLEEGAFAVGRGYPVKLAPRAPDAPQVLPQPVEQLPVLEGLLDQVLPQLESLIGPERAEAFQRALAAQNGDVQRLLAPRFIRFVNDLDVLARSRRMDNIIEINWGVFDDPDVEAIERVLAHQVIPHEADRYRLEYRPPSFERKFPARLSSSFYLRKMWGIEEFVAVLRNMVRIRSMGPRERETVLAYLRRHEAAIDGHQPYVHLLEQTLKAGDTYDARVDLAFNFVTDPRAYPEELRMPRDGTALVDAKLFAERVGRYLGGILDFALQERDLAQYFLAQLGQPGLTTDEALKIFQEAIRVEEAGIKILEPVPLPNSSIAWLQRLKTIGRLDLLTHLSPQALADLIVLMDQALPLANEFIAKGTLEVFYAYLPSLARPAQELLSRVAEMDMQTDPGMVRDLVIFMRKAQTFVEESEITMSTVEDFTLTIPDEIFKERGTIATTQEQLEAKFRELIDELSAMTDVDRSQVKRILYELVALGRWGDVEKATEEELIPVTLVDWVRYVVEKGHIRRLTGYRRADLDDFVDLTHLVLPMYALANYLMLYWPHWIDVYFVEQDAYYASPNVDPTKTDPLTTLQAVVFQYKLEALREVAEWALGFLLTPHGAEFLSVRWEPQTQAVSVEAEGRREILELPHPRVAASMAGAMAAVSQRLGEFAREDKFLRKFPSIAGRINAVLASGVLPDLNATQAGGEERLPTEHAARAFEAWWQGYGYLWPARELDLLTRSQDPENSEREALQRQVDEMYRQRATAIMEFLLDVGLKPLHEAIERQGGRGAAEVVRKRWDELSVEVIDYFERQLHRVLGREISGVNPISPEELDVVRALLDPYPTAGELWAQWKSGMTPEKLRQWEADFVNYFTGTYGNFALYLGAVWESREEWERFVREAGREPLIRARPGVQRVGACQIAVSRVRYRERYGQAPGPWWDDFDEQAKNEFFLIVLAPLSAAMPEKVEGFEKIVEAQQEGLRIQISRARAFASARQALQAWTQVVESGAGMSATRAGGKGSTLSQEQIRAALGRYAGHRILVVEDSPYVRTMLLRILREEVFAGIAVTIDDAENLNGALAALRAQDYDLVITDFLLGDGTGADVAEWLKKQGKSARIVLHTLSTREQIQGHLDREMMPPFERLFDAYLPKPLEGESALNSVLATLAPQAGLETQA